MSNASKGKAFEKKVGAFLEKRGFKVEICWPKYCFIGKGRVIAKQNDFFRCADLIAIHPNRPYTFFIQATVSISAGDTAERRRKMESVPWNLKAQKVFVIRRMPNKCNWQIHQMLSWSLSSNWSYIEINYRKLHDYNTELKSIGF